MGNIIDYIKWRGDISFDERKLNEIDNLVFCQIAYIDFNVYDLDSEEPILSKIITKMIETKQFKMQTIDGETNYKEYLEFAKMVASSQRFGNVKIEKYVDITDATKDLQFAAMSFEFKKDNYYIAFRGTDNTLVGWKEDFMISFTEVLSQKKSLEYLENNINSGKNYIIGGHSKGGNLALYALSYLSTNKKNLIEHIYLNDSPGLCNDVFETLKTDDIDSITSKIIPEYCIIGKLFETKITDTKIVKSSARAMMQHSLITWQIRQGKLFKVSKNDAASIWINDVLDEWIENVDQESRKQFVEDVFGALYVNNVKTVNDVLNGGIDNLEKVLHNFSKSDKKTKKTAFELPITTLFGNGLKNLKLTNFIKVIKKSSIIRSLGIMCLGILFHYLPYHFLLASIGITLFIGVLLEVGYTIYKIMKSKNNMDSHRVRVYICLISIAIYSVILLRENALVLISTFAFGSSFVWVSYNLSIKTKDVMNRKYVYAWKIGEVILFAVCGLFILVASNSMVFDYLKTAGWFLYIDGIINLVFEILEKARMERC